MTRDQWSIHGLKIYLRVKISKAELNKNKVYTKIIWG